MNNIFHTFKKAVSNMKKILLFNFMDNEFSKTINNVNEAKAFYSLPFSLRFEE